MKGTSPTACVKGDLCMEVDLLITMIIMILARLTVSGSELIKNKQTGTSSDKQ